MDDEALRAEHEHLRAAVDVAVGAALARGREAVHPQARPLVDDLARLHAAGGGRLRGVLLWWGHRATEAPDDDRVPAAAAAIELLHLMAIVHDDLMDDAPERRGVPACHVALETAAPGRGRSLAILAGDLAAVLADRELDGAGFPAGRLAAARRRYDAIRIDMASGQYLDLVPGDASAADVASLKGGSYSIEGPLVVGALLGGADDALLARLSAFGRPLGTAFQLRDDLADGEAPRDAALELAAQRARALAALAGDGLPAEVAAALATIAAGVEAP
ncbi:MAG TPA: polyprenyl synthetase family protein [Actinomycetota bacterium]|nr:polyprenyl synthetase family protein [Actinomycetota bacterium]